MAACAGQPVPPQSTADSRSLGKPNAPVVMLEFSDLQCPYCARFALDTFPALRRRYIDTGKVRFETHDMPLPFHAYAVPAAIAARCGGRQGRFWEYREALFRAQQQLDGAPYDAIAAALGLDVERFKACRADPAVAEEVRTDETQAASRGVSSTPTLMVGRMVKGELVGEVIVGAQPLEVFVKRIDELLKQ